MNDDRSLERAARSWIEEGPTRASDRPVDAALRTIESTPQERGLALPWGLTNLNPPMRLAGAAIVAVLAVGVALFALRPAETIGPPGPTAPPSPTVATEPTAAASAYPTERTYPSNPPVVLPSSLPVPTGDPLPANLIGRTYEVNPPEIQGTQHSILTLRAADDPHCVGLFGGRSTCFTVLWTPNGPRHINDPAARGSARIVDGNLVLGLAWVPNDKQCEGISATYAIEDAGATLRGLNPPACTFPGFTAVTLPAP
jgi:hypothetical protein